MAQGIKKTSIKSLSARRTIMHGELKQLGMLLTNKRVIVCMTIVIAFTFMGIIGPYFSVDPFDFVGYMYEPPSLHHPLGTDIFGRDILAQLLYGIRNSLMVGVIAGALSLLIALVLGGISGYTRGLLGEILNSIINIFLVIPTVPLLILLSALVEKRSLLLVALFIGLVTGWPGSARAIRAQVMSLREKEFVNLAIITGKKSRHIIFGEIFSNMVTYIFLQFCGCFANAILAEAGISLLGLGPVDVPTLGMMLHWAIMSGALLLGVWWWFLPPGIVLVVICAALYTIAGTEVQL